MGSQPPAVGWSVHRDAGGVCKTVESISPIVGNNTTEGTGVVVDLKGYEGAKVVISIGTALDTLDSDNYITPSLTDCATSDGTFAALDSTQYIRHRHRRPDDRGRAAAGDVEGGAVHQAATHLHRDAHERDADRGLRGEDAPARRASDVGA
jgi:hypothetical protein